MNDHEKIIRENIITSVLCTTLENEVDFYLSKNNSKIIQK